MAGKYLKKVKHNHTRNLETVLTEIKRHRGQGVSLAHLAVSCGVSTRQVYRYLNELQKLGYEILKVAPTETAETGGYTLRETENSLPNEMPLLNMLDELSQLSKQIAISRSFVKEFLFRLWLSKLGTVLPLNISVAGFNHADAVNASGQTVVLAARNDGDLEEIKIRVSPRVIGSVTERLATELIAKQRQKDGRYILLLKTYRAREMAGVLVQWGSEVEVLEPGWLRYRILENCKAVLHANRLRKTDKTLYSRPGRYMVIN
ncbi:WYL domain-containing protein [Desulforamulus hydrothermalis]|uniref:Helix-turn-helix, type 11 domain protein n=1 Tax=Desulforamulus hydrothermalis Lam5 = DSM 18033 TaxID=1121428 RepID=K8E156_9FIRM|nr:WYL domain-containing protein [Desulforamulus hydrothermalis]CCO09462.1 Helix-turn-helix, type 11 domain protein [Desulforamulus hydrothermalis Lam5 = DSM 18033]SHH07689.1 HTH domain-containing protein [Desulforamulus hydrothermalis Lam5 = DSM 18033]